jgi:hypothetical protein
MNDIELTYSKLSDTYLDITKSYLTIDDSNVEKALLQHTGVYAFFGAVLAHAKKKSNAVESEYEYEEAKIRESKRREMQEEGKRATDRALDAYVKTVEELRILKQSVNGADHRYNLARNIMHALDHQKDMLVQISANKRAEVKLVGDI